MNTEEIGAAAVLRIQNGPAAAYIPFPELVTVERHGELACVLVRSTVSTALHVSLDGNTAYGGTPESFWRADPEDESDDALGVGVIAFELKTAPESGKALVRNVGTVTEVPLVDGRWGLLVNWSVRCDDWIPELVLD